MDRICLLLQASEKGAMNKQVANVHLHYVHAKKNKCVFWDRNITIPLKRQEQIKGNYLYIYEKVYGVQFRFTIVDFYDGQTEYQKILDTPSLKQCLPKCREYKGSDLEKVKRGKKCKTFIRLTAPMLIGPYEIDDFIREDGSPLKRDYLRENGAYVKAMEAD